MKNFGSSSTYLRWFKILLLSALAAGCGGGGGTQIFGTGGATRAVAPTVTAVAPLANATGVPISTKVITAAFDHAMNSATLTTTSFTLACPAATPVTGVVTYLTPGSVATLTLPAAPDLPPSTVCTGTVTTAATDTTGISLAANFTWNFTTGVTPDTTRPRVTLTAPVTTVPGPTLAVPTNTAITAIFTEDMAPASIVAAGTFTVTCAAPCVSPTPVGGGATYVVGSRTATYTPTAVLANSTTYTATITTAATDLALNALAGNQAALPAASNYVWTFTTAAAPVPPAPVSVLSTQPLNAAVGVCPSATVNATFTVPSGLRMDPATVNAATFTVTGPGATVVAASTVALDVATGKIATFTPLVALTNGTVYTATITSGATGVKDLAVPANQMAADKVWTFTAGPATGACLVAPSLGAAQPFGVFGGAAGMTNMGNLTIVNGDLGTIATGTSAITGFHDTPPSDSYTETCPGTPLLATGCGFVNGKIYTCTVSSIGPTSAISIGPATQNPVSCNIANVALLAAGTAYTTLAGLAPGGVSPAPGANLGSLTLGPGVYVAPGGSFQIAGGDLTLDPQGDANAVWVFKMATTLTIGDAVAGRSINLLPPGQAKNVFWQVGSSAVINALGGGTIVGTVITGGPPPGIAVSTSGNIAPVTVNGRLITTTVTGASVTIVNTIINVPAP